MLFVVVLTTNIWAFVPVSHPFFSLVLSHRKPKLIANEILGQKIGKKKRSRDRKSMWFLFLS